MKLRCHKHGRAFCLGCVVQTVSFPLEHYVWEKLPVFSLITKALGL